MRDLAGQATEATKRHNEVQRVAADILRRQESGQDRYNQALKQTGVVYRAGLITQKQFLSEARQLKFTHLGGAEAAKRSADAERDRAKALAMSAIQQKRVNQLQASARQRMIKQGGSKQIQEQSERNRLQAEGARVLRQLETAQDRYNQRLLETQRLRRRGAITDAQAVRLVRRYKEELRQASDALKSTFGADATARLQSFVAGLFCAGSAVAAIRNEFQELSSLSNSQASIQQNASGADRNLRVGIVGESLPIRNTILAARDQIARDQHLPQGLVSDTIRKATSASNDPLEGLKNAEASLAITANTRGGDAFTAAVGDIRGALDSDTDTAIGFATRVLGRSRVEEAPKLGANLSRVLAFGRSYEQSPKEAAALFSALTQGGADATGEVSRTASIQLIRQLGGFFANGGPNGKLDPASVDELREQVTMLQTRPKLRDQFLADASFESGALGAIRGLLQGTVKTYNRTLEDLSGDLGAVGREARRFVNEGKLQQAGALGRALDSASETIGIAKPILLGEEDQKQLTRAVFEAEKSTSGITPLSEYETGLTIDAGFKVNNREALRYAEGNLSRIQDLTSSRQPTFEVQVLEKLVGEMRAIAAENAKAAQAQRDAATALVGGGLQNPRQE